MVRRVRARRVVLSLLTVVASVATVGCGSDADDASSSTLAVRPQVERIDDAVQALVAELGPEVRFFEINADDRLVNLFVAIDDASAAVAYVYLDDELQPPAPPRSGASGFTFAADTIEFDPDRVLSQVTDALPGSVISRFVLLGTPDGTSRREVVVTSRQGGILAVEVGPEGDVRSVEPL